MTKISVSAVRIVIVLVLMFMLFMTANKERKAQVEAVSSSGITLYAPVFHSSA
jgi:hypothetical protein